MKTKLVTCFICLFSSFLFSQQVSYTNEKDTLAIITQSNIDAFRTKYQTLIDSILIKYQGNSVYNSDNWVVHSDLLNKQLEEIFNKLIFGKADIVNAASAFALTINEDKTTASANFNLPLKFKCSVVPDFLNLGLNASGKGKIFNFYNDGSWQNSVEGSFGASWKLTSASRYYSIKDHQKDDLYKRRKFVLELFLKDPSFKMNFSIDNYKLIEKIIQLYEQVDFDEVVNNHSDLLSRYPEYKKLYLSKDLAASYQFLYKERELIRTFFDTVLKGDDAIEKFTNKKFVEFDENNVALYGYNNMFWLDVSMSFSNNGFKFIEENITVMDVDAFSKNVLGITLKADLNWSRETKNDIFYLNGGLSYDRGSFMNSSLINGTPKIILDTSNEVVIIDDRERVLGTVKNIKDHFETGSLYVYGAWFGTKNKNIGLNVSFSHQYVIDLPGDTDFNNNFSLLGGPLAKTKDGSTFGIDVGFSNAVYNTRIVDDFVVRLRAGIPFNIIANNKTK